VFNYTQPRKKDLTLLAFALILAQVTPIFASLLYYWRPRAKKIKGRTGERVAAGGCFT